MYLDNEGSSEGYNTVDGRFIAYYRVSTAKQGKSGLGLDAQKAAVLSYLNGGNWKLMAEFTEVESGKNNRRAELERALHECRLTGATLLVAKLDRLSRNAAFLMTLKDAKTKFVACDMPDANDMTIGIMAVIAQHEREAISARTKAALAQSTKKLGGWRGGPVGDPTAAREALSAKAAAYASTVAPIVRDLRDEGLSLREIAARLVARGVKTSRGGAWTASAVRRLLD